MRRMSVPGRTRPTPLPANNRSARITRGGVVARERNPLVLEAWAVTGDEPAENLTVVGVARRFTFDCAGGGFTFTGD
jgi:hypothetical protein